MNNTYPQYFLNCIFEQLFLGTNHLAKLMISNQTCNQEEKNKPPQLLYLIVHTIMTKRRFDNICTLSLFVPMQLSVFQTSFCFAHVSQNAIHNNKLHGKNTPIRRQTILQPYVVSGLYAKGFVIKGTHPCRIMASAISLSRNYPKS